MAQKEIAGKIIDVNEEGYLTNFEQWDKDIASEIALSLGVSPLTDEHWKVISFIQSDAKERGSIPTIRRLKKVGRIQTDDLYRLFPSGPLKKAAKIAGLTKPESCI